MISAARLKTEREGDFRLRGKEVSRLECFSDCVFAFALTLLVVSLEAPKSFQELMETMRGFAAFGVCFAILAGIWNSHYVYSRRFGLDDAPVRFLTCFLLFVVLLYVYPLKFVFTLFINSLLGISSAALSWGEARTAFTIYGFGYAIVFIAFILLYLHAYRRSDELELSSIERFDTRSTMYAFALQAGVAVISMILANTLPARMVGMAGFSYFLIGPALGMHGMTMGKKRRGLETHLLGGDAPSSPGIAR